MPRLKTVPSLLGPVPTNLALRTLKRTRATPTSSTSFMRVSFQVREEIGTVHTLTHDDKM